MSAPNVTYMRCHRVESALESDPNIRQMLGSKEHTIYKPPNNTPVKFSEEVLVIAQVIKDRNLEANKLTQREILVIAMPLLYDREDGKPMPKFVPEPPPAAAPVALAPTPKPKTVAKPKPKPAPEQKPKPKPVAKPKTKPKLKVAAQDVASNGPLPQRHEAPQAELGQSKEEVKRIFDAPLPAPSLEEVVTVANGLLPYVWAVTINTLLLSCLQLLHANKMKDSSFYKRVDDLSHELDKLTVIPRPTHAKESSNSIARTSAAA